MDITDALSRAVQPGELLEQATEVCALIFCQTTAMDNRLLQNNSDTNCPMLKVLQGEGGGGGLAVHFYALPCLAWSLAGTQHPCCTVRRICECIVSFSPPDSRSSREGGSIQVSSTVFIGNSSSCFQLWWPQSRLGDIKHAS
jgi:hypothetical protein